MRHNLPFIATFSSGRGARYTIVESADMRWKVGDDVEPLPRITGLRIGATCNHRRCASVFAPGDCDNSNNSAECGYDGGDCVGVELLTYQQLKIPENGYTFRVSRFDDGRKTPYRIYFWNEALTGSSYRFDGNGDLVYFKAGSEVYYDVFKNDIHEAIEFSRKPESDGGKKRDDDYEFHDDASKGDNHMQPFREEFSCNQCSEALSAVCGAGSGHIGGLHKFCDAVDLSALGDDGAGSVRILCENSDNACTKAIAACDSVCGAGE